MLGIDNVRSELRGVFLLLFLLISGVSSSAWATKVSEAKLKDMIRKSKLKEDDFGIAIGSAHTSASMADLNANQMMIPASITKLVTGAAVLDQIPPGSKVKTQLLSTSIPTGKILAGDLCLKGGGDPGFVSESMWYLVNAFIRSEISEIRGKLIVDDSLFDDSYFDESRQEQRVDRAYDAPVSAMSFNWNSVNVFVRPGLKAGDPARVFLDPENDFTQLEGRILTGNPGGTHTVSAERKNGRGGKGEVAGDIIQVAGKIPADQTEVVLYKSISEPALWAGENLKSFLRQRGVQLKGPVVRGSCASEAQVLAEAESEPIERMLADMNKFSNNYVAEMLTKLLASLDGRPGTIKKGMAKMDHFLRTLGVSASEMKLQNPSGLTRDNRLTARALLKVLQHLKDDFRLTPEMFVSLPIAGVDGTLKRRLKGTTAERFVRAKTGYLTGVISLAGYAGNSKGDVYPFVFIYNGNGDESKVRGLFDQFVLRLVE